VVAEKKGKSSEAEKYLNLARQQASGSLKEEIAVTLFQEQWYASKNDFKKVLKSAEELVAKYPDETQALDFLARAQVANGRPDLAASVLQKIISKDNTDIQHRLQLADLLAKQPDNQKEV